MEGVVKAVCTILGVFLLSHNSSANIQPESQLPTSCNSCCQGQPGGRGDPGIPGVPGNHGMPGSLGQKGDKGDTIKGEPGNSIKGDIGPSGNHGLKGETGGPGLRGMSGKIGPSGIAGSVGPSGIPGLKGQKGEMAHNDVGQSRVSAFSSVKTKNFGTSSANQAIPFDRVHTNIGEDFDAASGRFTCEIPGVYLFTYNMLTWTGNPRVSLMKNNVQINTVYRSGVTFHDMIGNSAVLQLASGDQLWLRYEITGAKIHNSDTYQCATFNGVILHQL